MLESLETFFIMTQGEGLEKSLHMSAKHSLTSLCGKYKTYAPPLEFTHTTS